MSRTKTERNGNGAKCEVSVWTRAITANSEWPDKVNITLESRRGIPFYRGKKSVEEIIRRLYIFFLPLSQEEFLDVIYWARQAIGIIVGIGWGLIPLKGFIALLL